MLYCPLCQVKVAGEKRCCPLCKGQLTGTPEPESEIFPQVVPPHKLARIARRIVLYTNRKCVAPGKQLAILCHCRGWLPLAFCDAGDFQTACPDAESHGTDNFVFYPCNLVGLWNRLAGLVD